METARWMWTGVSVGTAVITGLIAYSVSAKPQKVTLPEIALPRAEAAETEAPPARETVPAADEPPQTQASAYLLRLDENTLSVYQEGIRTPLETYDLPAGALPEYDRILLEYGIRVKNENELCRLLEDYLS